ncbi:uncharacterized protein [Rutidosis leptorrhynchoides]|uniref:uncharacterized protein n=1 Tax=Rutidosis leptorrhynchoides TaxID=125765 RepID=UPI003A992684
MPTKVAKSIGIRELVRTNTSIRFGNQTVDDPIGVAEDVLFIIHGICYKEDFFIMDCEPDVNTPIVLGRGFLATARMSLDFDTGTLIIKDEDNMITFRMEDGFGSTTMEPMIRTNANPEEESSARLHQNPHTFVKFKMSGRGKRSRSNQGESPN